VETVQVRIRYRGRGSLERFGVVLPRPEMIEAARAWSVGDELIPSRPGWFVHEITIDRVMITYVVELRRPD
jgi:hypothetical protein